MAIFSAKELDTFNFQGDVNEPREIDASKFEVNTKLLVKTLDMFSIHLRNNGITKLETKKRVNRIIDQLVNQDLFFDGFAIIKNITTHIDRIFKTPNLKDELVTLLKEEYQVNNASNKAVKNFLNNKVILENNDLRQYIENLQ